MEELIEKFLDTVVQIALDTGDMLRTRHPSVLKLESRKDFLTTSDLEADSQILEALKIAFPEIPSLSEESGGERVNSGLQWVIDPLDGSLNYFFGDLFWGVSISLTKDGETIAGVVHLPAKLETFCATVLDESEVYRPVEGCDLDWRKNWYNVSVSPDTSLYQSQVWTDWVKEKSGGADHQRVRDIFGKLGRHTLYPQIRLCCTASMMMVAQGKIAGYVHPGPEPFDIAAAGLIVERAGGRVTDMQGNPWSPFSKSIVATNGLIHDELLAVLNQ